jgi:hypothetical protein
MVDLSGEPIVSKPQRPAVFVSASIPTVKRYSGQFDAFEITEAVVALARVFLTAGYCIVTAAHPTISPLLFYVAAELPEEQQGDRNDRVLVYQSRLFEDRLPASTKRFETEGVGRVIWTPATPGEEPIAGRWHRSLRTMRREMLASSQPVASCFVGGMLGIIREHRMFRAMFPGRPSYAVGYPGGVARALTRRNDAVLNAFLESGNRYPSLWRAVVSDLEERS